MHNADRSVTRNYIGLTSLYPSQRESPPSSNRLAYKGRRSLVFFNSCMLRQLQIPAATRAMKFESYRGKPVCSALSCTRRLWCLGDVPFTPVSFRGTWEALMHWRKRSTRKWLQTSKMAGQEEKGSQSTPAYHWCCYAKVRAAPL